MKRILSTIALATLTACATANTGGGATPLLSASTCGTDQSCMVKQSLTSMGTQFPGIQDDGGFIDCHFVLGDQLNQAQVIADNRARAALISLLQKPVVMEYFKGKMTFAEGTLIGYGPDGNSRRSTQAGNGFLICTKLVNLAAAGGGNEGERK